MEKRTNTYIGVYSENIKKGRSYSERIRWVQKKGSLVKTALQKGEKMNRTIKPFSLYQNLGGSQKKLKAVSGNVLVWS
jgi:hypothetical protein